MKKKFLSVMSSLALSFVFALSACTVGHTEHFDNDNDGKCDECGETMQTTPPHTEHFDNDNDGKCDECGETMQTTPPHTEHVDSDNDGKCDECGETMQTTPPHTEHVDKDNDGKCDECGEELQVPPSPPPHTEHVDSNNDGICDECGETVVVTPEGFAVNYREGYTPTYFDINVTNEITELGEGVHLVKNVVQRGSLTCVVWAVEVDLNKANVVAGTKDNASTTFNWAKTTPYKTAQAWEQATGGHVYASVNADFFGSYSVNAFVKDGVIVKDGHNDNGNYDYKNSSSDVPASAPMLFGINGTKAQIAPIITVDGDPTDASVKQQLVKAKLSYELVNGTKHYEVKENAAPDGDYITFRTLTSSVSQRNGVALKVDISKGYTNMEVLEKVQASRTNIAAGDGYAWLLSTGSIGDCVKYLDSFNVGDKISLSVTSPDGAWNDYETILGCRQALVTGDKIASTVTLENTNGAQSAEVPRTAVGLKDDHTVVVFAVESLHYYGKNVQPSDPHGMNLPQLAEFIYFYGCTEAANFDGGGSTQLITTGAEDETPTVRVRSADYGTWGLNETRVVMNTLLVTNRKEG